MSAEHDLQQMSTDFPGEPFGRGDTVSTMPCPREDCGVADGACGHPECPFARSAETAETPAHDLQQLRDALNVAMVSTGSLATSRHCNEALAALSRVGERIDAQQQRIQGLKVLLRSRQKAATFALTQRRCGCRASATSCVPA